MFSSDNFLLVRMVFDDRLHALRPGANGVYGYEAFPVGDCGPKLKAKSSRTLFLSAPDANLVAVLKAAAGFKNAAVLWSFALSPNNNILQPSKLVLVTTKQVAIPAAGSAQL